MAQGNPKALIPIPIFVVLYLGMSITLEYGLHVEMRFYSIPVLLIFLIALAIAFLQTKNVDYDGKFSIMADPTEKMILYLGAGLGLRREEIATIKLSDFKGNKIMVNGKGHGRGKLVEKEAPQSVLRAIE